MVQKTKVKKTIMPDIFTTSAAPRVKAADNNDLDTGKIGPVSAGLMTGEKAALKDIAARHDLTINAVIRYALRQFIIDVRSGKVDIEAALTDPEPAKPRLKLPT